MSLMLSYRPIIEKKTIRTDGKLIEILSKKLSGLPKIVSHEMDSYLEVLVDADICGAKELLEVIKNYSSIELSKEE